MIAPPDHPESEPRFTTAVRAALVWSEDAVYIIVGLRLLAAAVLVVGTVSGLIASIRTRQSAVNIRRRSPRPLSDLAILYPFR